MLGRPEWETGGVAQKNQKPLRSRAPESTAFHHFMTTGWAESHVPQSDPVEVASFAAMRRETLRGALDELPKDSVVIVPAGARKQRSNDTDYPYRPHSAFSYLTGWGSSATPESMLRIDQSSSGSPAVLYARGPADRTSDEFYASAELGEFWTGPRPHLDDISKSLGLEVLPLEDWDGISDDDLHRTLIVADGDPLFTASLASRRVKKLGVKKASALSELDAIVTRVLSEMRFVKDAWEIEQMRRAVAATHRGFDDTIGAIPRAIGHQRGERIIEGVFGARARLEGHDVGYGTISAAGAHACILHWVNNDGPVTDGDLLLVDAGIELDSLYTADITRTVPVSGRFTEQQRMVYEAVLEAADYAMAKVRPGIPFRAIHDAAMEVIASHVERWGFLPVPLDEALSKEGGQHRRYMIHGTSHHLGLDVHDCAKARREMYVDQELKPGMVFTIEPGLYFQPDDLTVPEQWRGIGVRIEDNILVTEDGFENLSAAIPRTVAEVEAWLAQPES
jgi:Xaa-Pro aminopeptidase